MGGTYFYVVEHLFFAILIFLIIEILERRLGLRSASAADEHLVVHDLDNVTFLAVIVRIEHVLLVSVFKAVAYDALAVGLIGNAITMVTGLVLPAIYEHMGLKDDYNVLYNDEMRNNLFTVLIICSIVGSIMNLIPYLFYDLTEKKHRGYVNVLKIRAMFEEYGNGELEDAQLIDAMKIINGVRADLQKKTVDKRALALARKNKDKEAILNNPVLNGIKESGVDYFRVIADGLGPILSLNPEEIYQKTKDNTKKDI